VAATQVRLDGTTIARADTPIIHGNLYYLASDLVSQHSRIREKGLHSIERMKIRAADSHAANSHQRFTGLGHGNGDAAMAETPDIL